MSASRDCFERFPQKLSIALVQHTSYVALYVDACTGPARRILNTATDCKPADGYRWYQIFSMAFAAHFGWSPILRDALGLKRRGNRELEKGEDGVRAQMIEEYVIALLFLNRDWLTSSRAPSQNMIDEICSAVSGLEVARVTNAQWSAAIESGRDAWQCLNKHGSGIATIDLKSQNLDVNPGGFDSFLSSESVAPMIGFDKTELIDETLVALIEVKPGVAELFRPLLEGGWVNVGSKAEEWSRDLTDGFRWHDTFHLANLAILSWSPVASSILGLSRPDLRPQLIEEAIIARAYEAFLRGKREDVQSVARLADRFCYEFGGQRLGVSKWELALVTGWDLSRRLNGTSGAVLCLDPEKQSVSVSSCDAASPL